MTEKLFTGTLSLNKKTTQKKNCEASLCPKDRFSSDGTRDCNDCITFIQGVKCSLFLWSSFFFLIFAKVNMFALLLLYAT